MQNPQPFIIDVEASGFGVHSYPIEVGLALEPGKRYCSLISPREDWTHWEEEAARTHGIEKNTLQKYGNSVVKVALQLNQLLSGVTVYSDGWVVDHSWINTLFHAAGVEKKFTVSSLEMILSEHQMEIWHHTRQQVIEDLRLVRHRASHDALIIQETYRRTLNS